MTTIRSRMLFHWRKAIGILTGLVLACTAMASSGQGFTAYGTPVGHDKYMVLMANGVYDPQDPQYTPPDFKHFSQEVMGWSEAEEAEFESRARTFFAERFGIDTAAPEYAGRVMMVPFMLDPRWEYRVYNSSGEYVPQQGWVVRDGGYQLVVVDPEGVSLGGEFQGQKAPMGALAAYGKYNIKRSIGRSHKHRELVIHYQSREPVLQNSGFPLQRDGQGVLIAPLEVQHPEHGAGWAFAHIVDVTLENGLRQTNNRNIMTFPAGASFPGWLK